MKRWQKILSWSLAIAFPLGIIIGFSVQWTSQIAIFCQGSSGVKPFVEFFANQYSQYNSQIDITVEAGGSGFGISQIAKNYTNIGNASKNPYGDIIAQDEYISDWKNHHIKTVTVAWEGICLVYIPPKNWSWNENVSFDNLLDINASNAAALFTIFAGYKYHDQQITLKDFVNPNVSDKLTSEQINELSNTKVIPYVRTGGAMTSGTAASFYQDIYLDGDWALDESVHQALQFGRYGPEKHYETDEANSRAFDVFDKNHESGSIVYLSSGFVQQNLDLIKKKKYGIFSFQNQKYEIDKVTQGYNWYRPLNMMFFMPEMYQNTSNNVIETWPMKFVDYMLFGKKDNHPITSSDLLEIPSDQNLRIGDDQIQTYWNNIGAVGLSWSQLLSMCLKNTTSDNFWQNFWVSDAFLNNLQDKSSDIWKDQAHHDTIFGAKN